MKVNLKGSVFVITGKLTKMTRHEAEAAIEEVKGETANSVTKKTDYLIVGERPSSKYTKAKNMGIPILTEDDFKALIAGETVEVDAIGEAGDRSVDELLGEVRSVMQGSPSAEMWSELVKLLDACRAEDVHVLTDYIDGYIARWSAEQMKGLTGTSVDASDTKGWRMRWWWYNQSSVEGELRVAPEHWVGEMQQGIESPKYKIVCALEFTGTKMTSTAVAKVISHPSLTQLEVLELPERLAPSKGLVKTLCTHPTLRHLQLGKIDEKTGGFFLDLGKEPRQLEVLDLSRLDVPYGLRDEDEICKFAKANYFSTVTSFHFAGNTQHDQIFSKKIISGDIFPSIEHIHITSYYNAQVFWMPFLLSDWGAKQLKRLTAERIFYRGEESWGTLLSSDFAGHLEVLDLSSVDDENITPQNRKLWNKLLDEELPTARLLEHVDTLILGKWRTEARAKKLEEAFPELTVK